MPVIIADIDAASQDGTLLGLTTQEAAQRLNQFGLNESASKQGKTPWLDQVLLLFNPLSVVLLVAAAISLTIGERFDAILITAIVLIGGGIDFAQTYHARITIERLRATVAATATAKRDGTWREIPRSQIVPGDVIRLSAGDLVPADARLAQSRDLALLQAMLTGESTSVEKRATSDAASSSADAVNMIFLGTSVVSGTGTAIVTATGRSTAFGDIVAHLAAKPPETAFDLGIKRFSYMIARIVFVMVLLVLAANLAMHRPPIESLLFAVALAVGLTPEFLPMITSVTLSRGAVAMARKHVVVKHLPAIQNLGSIDVLCSDKTGTLTAGTMSLVVSASPDGTASSAPQDLALINSSLQAGIRSPLDKAILAGNPTPPTATKIDELPFDFQRRRLSVIVDHAGQRTLICKGSPEGIFPLLTSFTSGDKVLAMTAEALSRAKAYYTAQSTLGYRVLAVATRTLPVQPQYKLADESVLTLNGFLSFADTILPDAAETIARLQGDGVSIKILTGDNELVAAHICAQAGLPVAEIVLGTELELMSDNALTQVAERANVFARVSPPQKLRILTALRRRGHTVGFMGDGINDAPSLHAADVGIAAPGAVDVAQDAADVVLLQPGLAVLHEGILEGRRAFGNVMKYLLMGTSSNFGNVLSMAVAAVALPFLPMLPAQVLLNNFLYDLSQLTIPTDRVDAEYFSKPQKWDIAIIRRFMVLVGPISSIFDFLTFYVLLHFFRAGPAEFHTGWFVESLATQTLVLLVIRTVRSPFRSRPSTGLLLSVIFIVAVGFWLPYSRFAADLAFTRLPLTYFAFLAAATVSYLLCVELAKRYIMSTSNVSAK
ncbi:magnesium-translocating P-type ATPase [Terriglobus roseus DSM 18391]|uniref:Magnesium-transporting ATPase, P-type 1 n=1 Tax=Terriglobus roseus (strain DSM 18391 / NRRL B-41598 / KBS 63) TaxID=926566 RepID=I3ZHT7_TERRK|nr:magnesium-translocating P-type ATPase [Terriglobus roseus]AFL88463.1 magnesium-translocating P-type ATPase [Terriglobus roseus DSM 18391]AFL88805.1 magnesium-translocating P-type ATPase [Terriglobus roseus DSM 18391]